AHRDPRELSGKGRIGHDSVGAAPLHGRKGEDHEGWRDGEIDDVKICHKERRDGRAVDGGGLENHCGGNSTGGSNPSPSAKSLGKTSIQQLERVRASV